MLTVKSERSEFDLALSFTPDFAQGLDLSKSQSFHP